MSESGSDDDGSYEGFTADLEDEQGRNKRRFLSKLPLEIPVDTSTMSLTEFPRYEMLEEKFRNALNELGSMIKQRSKAPMEEQDLDDCQLDADWDDPVASQLEELLMNNLHSTFGIAVKKIVESGYAEQVAEWAVLNSRLFHGGKDAVSNVVECALALLEKVKEGNMPKHPIFEGLQSLVNYTLLELIHVLREVRPDLTIAEAMWCLLISDLSLINACALEVCPPGCSSSSETSVDRQTLSQSKSETPSSTQLDSNNSIEPKQMMPQGQSSPAEAPVATSPGDERPACKLSPRELASPGKESSPALQESKGNSPGVGKEHTQSSSQRNAEDEKLGESRKGSSSSSKREMLRQKTFQEKNYKGRISKGAFKAKGAAWGSMVLDKPLKPQSGLSSVAMKSAYSKLSTGETSSSPVEARHPDVRPKSETDVPNAPKPTDYCASIPFDETLQKHVPQDYKDEAILMLVHHKQALEKELQGWMDWANEKVMQAAQRLGKDQAELKMLRQEKEEVEKYKKEMQTLEESTMKRLSEMEHALSNTTSQIEVASRSLRRLQGENIGLEKEMEAAKMKAIESASNLQEGKIREQEYLKRLASWGTEKGLILEQRSDLRNQIVALNDRLDKAKRRQDQFKVLLNQEEKEKLRASNQIHSLRRKIEEEEARTKVEEDSIRQMAELDMQKCKANITNLENMISELRLESNKSKIAALSIGYGNIPGMRLPKITKRLAVFQDNFGGGDVDPKRECVMCMTDEISVVFLPCAHQVLCSKCSDLHEKKGMNDCPSCRTTIVRRISVTYRASG